MYKTLKIILLIMFSACFLNGYGQTQLNPDSLTYKINIGEGPMIDYIIMDSTEIALIRAEYKESKRVVAVLLCLTLGPFGMHRLYLGTKPEVAAAYSVTLGGGFGFVTVVDLFFLVFSKDISRFRNNPHFIMWRKESEK